MYLLDGVAVIIVFNFLSGSPPDCVYPSCKYQGPTQNPVKVKYRNYCGFLPENLNDRCLTDI